MSTKREPTIEPPCSDCVTEQKRTGRTDAVCSRHEKHVHAHTYHYEREHPFRQHDSNVIPTGTGDPRNQR